MRLDGRTPAQIETAIRWCQGDEFWRANIMAMPKLREKYDQLRLAAKRAGVQRAGGGAPSFADTARRVHERLAAEG